MTSPAPLVDVVARLRVIEASAKASDGVVCFARLYREVTESIAHDLGAGTFAASAFLARLDIVFADLFFSVVETTARMPSAWAPLFADRARRGIAPLQFALAGMNAHINRDLPVAIVTTCEECGVVPRRDSAERADFERVNDVLVRVEAKVKASYLTGFVAAVDRLLHRVDRLDDVLAMWDVRVARDAAWANAETLWAIRDEAGPRESFLATLDRTVGFAGRGLLVPADTWLRRVARKFEA